MDWMVPKNKLDRDQIAILNTIYDGTGNFFVKGCPGTGKSVLMAHMYREYIASHPHARVCVLTYTHALIDCIKDGLRDSALRIFTLPKFAGSYARSHWDLLLVDEAQDMQPCWADAIAYTGARAIFFGDFKQSIYGETLSESAFIDKFKPTTLELNTIYRLTQSTKKLVQTLFPGNVMHASVGTLVADTDIQLIKTDSHQRDYEFIVQKIQQYAKPQKPAAVLFRHRDQIKGFLRYVLPNPPRWLALNDDINEVLRSQGSVFRFLGNGYGNFLESDSRPIVYAMTWHSAKGLDFNTVALPAITESDMDAGPLYVALTRGRLNLFVSYVHEDESGIIRKMATCPVVKKIAACDDRSSAISNNEESVLPLF